MASALGQRAVLCAETFRVRNAHTGEAVFIGQHLRVWSMPPGAAGERDVLSADAGPTALSSDRAGKTHPHVRPACGDAACANGGWDVCHWEAMGKGGGQAGSVRCPLT